MNKIRVLITENHKTVRQGLKMIIAAEMDMEVVGEADNGHEAVSLAQKLQPDVIIMDISMPVLNGIEATTEIKACAPSVKILTLTRHDDKAYIHKLLQSGISGYVLKQSEANELLSAIRKIAGGGNYLDPAITERVFDICTTKQVKELGEIQFMRLSDRESEVLRLISRGYSNKEISVQLKTSIKTIETQKAAAMRKLNITGRTEIINYAILQGWLQDN